MNADQMPLLLESRKRLHFDGVTFDWEKDGDRLTSQLGKVYCAMRDGKWHTLCELSILTGGSEAGVSARLRDLRKPQFGKFKIQRLRRTGRESFYGLWEYRMMEKP